VESTQQTADAERTDVLVAGGGLAGLTLALQLRRAVPDVAVTVIESDKRPLPEAAFKVGESTVEIAIEYFTRHLGLLRNLRTRQLPKLGLRFFLGGGAMPLEERPEVGVHAFPPFQTFQIDRGRFENDLRDLADAAGVRLVEGARVVDVALAEDGNDHSVEILQEGSDARQNMHCRWFVDASGRRRILQKKLKLALDNGGHNANAAWFRIKGNLSVAELVPKQQKAWHRRIFEDRWLSTNHLLGPGYWVWLIPLSSGQTSVGVVVDADMHPDCRIHSLEALRPWFERHEPRLLSLLDGREVSDFLPLRNYSYGSRAVFSKNRWSCVGVAGVFLDPFYSPGSDYIGVGNTITTEMIRRDFKGELTEELVQTYNRLFLDGLYRIGLAIFRGTYRVFGAPAHIFLAKNLWDSGLYWAITCQVFFQDALSKPEILPKIASILERVAALQVRLQELCTEWAKRAKPKNAPGFFDIASVPFLQLVLLDMFVKKSGAELVRTLEINLDRLEEAAQFIFFKALEEVMPEQLDRFQTRWVNAWAVSLNPDAWERDGLFRPTSPPRDVAPMGQALYGGILAPLTVGGWIRRKLMKAFVTVRRGKIYYAAQPGAVRALATGRIRLRRWWFLKDQPSRRPTEPEADEPRRAVSSA
jgi:flavin-dependent dehydrogenase